MENSYLANNCYDKFVFLSLNYKIEMRHEHLLGICTWTCICQ